VRQWCPSFYHAARLRSLARTWPGNFEAEFEGDEKISAPSRQDRAASRSPLKAIAVESPVPTAGAALAPKTMTESEFKEQHSDTERTLCGERSPRQWSAARSSGRM